MQETSQLIRGLSDASLGQRSQAASAIFERGMELARRATEEWMADGDLSKEFVRDASGFAHTTVGIATNPENFARIRIANGSPRLAEVPPDQDAAEFELTFPGNIRLDILTTKDPSGLGAIARYLNKLGEGIQQIELMVRNIDRATEALGVKFGISPIYAKSRAGADGTRVNFFLVPASDEKKVLIELVESKLRK